MKLPLDPRLPISNSNTSSLTQRLYDVLRESAKAFNDSYMWDGMGSAAPTTGTWAQSDKYKNTSPIESGSGGSKYVVIGWVCTVSGTPGTWLDMRVLTGN